MLYKALKPLNQTNNIFYIDINSSVIDHTENIQEIKAINIKNKAPLLRSVWPTESMHAVYRYSFSQGFATHRQAVLNLFLWACTCKLPNPICSVLIYLQDFCIDSISSDTDAYLEKSKIDASELRSDICNLPFWSLVSFWIFTGSDNTTLKSFPGALKIFLYCAETSPWPSIRSTLLS